MDLTDEMLEIARRNAPIVAKNVGHANVEFRKGRIQDLALDFELLDAELKNGSHTELEVETIAQRLRAQTPMIDSSSVDVAVSNCVLNLVASSEKRQLFAELFRVLKPGGRAVISDIVGSDDVPVDLQNDPELWSGCISGALREDRFLHAFTEAGFEPVRILRREKKVWQHVGGIDFRSMTVETRKPGGGVALKPEAYCTPESGCC